MAGLIEMTETKSSGKTLEPLQANRVGNVDVHWKIKTWNENIIVGVLSRRAARTAWR